MVSGGDASSSAGIILTVVVSSFEIIVIIPIEGAAMGLSVPLSVLKVQEAFCCLFAFGSGGDSCGADDNWWLVRRHIWWIKGVCRWNKAVDRGKLW